MAIFDDMLWCADGFTAVHEKGHIFNVIADFVPRNVLESFGGAKTSEFCFKSIALPRATDEMSVEVYLIQYPHLHHGQNQKTQKHFHCTTTNSNPGKITGDIY